MPRSHAAQGRLGYRITQCVQTLENAGRVRAPEDPKSAATRQYLYPREEIPPEQLYAEPAAGWANGLHATPGYLPWTEQPAQAKSRSEHKSLWGSFQPHERAGQVQPLGQVDSPCRREEPSAPGSRAVTHFGIIAHSDRRLPLIGMSGSRHRKMMSRRFGQAHSSSGSSGHARRRVSHGAGHHLGGRRHRRCSPSLLARAIVSRSPR